MSFQMIEIVINYLWFIVKMFSRGTCIPNCIVTRKTNQFSEFLQAFHEVFKLLNPSEILLVYCYSLHRVTKRNGPNVGFNISYDG